MVSGEWGHPEIRGISSIVDIMTKNHVLSFYSNKQALNWDCHEFPQNFSWLFEK